MFDMRFLDNPHWVEDLRPMTGMDQPVREHLLKDPAWTDAIDRLEALLTDWIPRYWAAGKNYVTVAFGCTGGRHRSVCAAEEIAQRLRDAGFSPNVRHRDLASQPSDTIEEDPGHAAKGDSGSELNE